MYIYIYIYIHTPIKPADADRRLGGGGFTEHSQSIRRAFSERSHRAFSDLLAAQALAAQPLLHNPWLHNPPWEGKGKTSRGNREKGRGEKKRKKQSLGDRSAQGYSTARARTHGTNTNTKHDFPVGGRFALSPQPPMHVCI